MRIGLILIVVIVLLFGVAVLWLLFQQPKADRNWLPEQARSARAEIAGNTVTIHDVRNWTYDENSVLEDDWQDVTVDVSTITKVWFLIEPFSQIKAIGHTFLSFEFTDGAVLSFSVEAKREQGEQYSALKGQFRAYELSYQWGTERDFVTRRLIYLNHPLRLYPLTLEPAAAQALFRSLVEETNVLAEHPRFYNTLTANCTNVLAHIVNRHYPGTLPYGPSWTFTGYADLYLMRTGLVEMKDSKETTRTTHDLTPYRSAIQNISTTTPIEFSAGIRTLLTSQVP